MCVLFENMNNITESQSREAIYLILTLLDDDPCWHDHHGDCQAHGFESPCPHKQSKRLLEDLNIDWKTIDRDEIFESTDVAKSNI